MAVILNIILSAFKLVLLGSFKVKHPFGFVLKNDVSKANLNGKKIIF